VILWTIGYEKTRIDRFLAHLAQAGITRLVDVRALAWSRNASYSQKNLERSVTKAGIGYTHLQALGNPKPGRTAAHDGDAKGFERIYKEHLASDAGQAELARLKQMMAAERTCIMCLEREPERCHRQFICAALAQEGVEIRHLIEPDLFR
jgi:uncharacterized protein (DUF488 family)